MTETPVTGTVDVADKRPLTEFLIRHEEGRLDKRLTDEWTDLLASCAAVGKGGSLTLKLSVVPDGKQDENSSGAYVVVAEVTSKQPKFPDPKRVYFLDEHGLTRDDPRQHKLFGAEDVMPDASQDRTQAKDVN